MRDPSPLGTNFAPPDGLLGQLNRPSLIGRDPVPDHPRCRRVGVRGRAVHRAVALCGGGVEVIGTDDDLECSQTVHKRGQPLACTTARHALRRQLATALSGATRVLEAAQPQADVGEIEIPHCNKLQPASKVPSPRTLSPIPSPCRSLIAASACPTNGRPKWASSGRRTARRFLEAMLRRGLLTEGMTFSKEQRGPQR